MRKAILFTLAHLYLILSVQSQSKVFHLWKDTIPNSIYNASYIETTDTLDNWTKTKRVSIPTLTYYPAALNNKNKTAVIICPGGGYGALAIKHEGSQVAAWFNSLGIDAFVLVYRLPDASIMKDRSIGPLQDVQEAIRYVRRNAKEWNINASKIGIMGFSAGGHLAATASTLFNEKVYTIIDSVSARPDFSILIYPVISMDSSITHLGSRENLLGKYPSQFQIRHFSNELNINKNTPPAFLIHSLDDNAVSPLNSISYAMALRKYQIKCELHLYQNGGHGYGMGRTNNTESTWTKSCAKWLKANSY